MLRGAVAVCLLGLELYPHGLPFSPYAAIYTAYLVYSAGAIWWQNRDGGTHDLARLLIDLIVFLLCTTQPPDRSGWFIALFYAFLLLNASVFHHLREVSLVATAATVFTVLVARDQIFTLAPTVVVAGALAIALGWQKRSLNERLNMLARQTVMFRTEAENARELERQRIAADFHDGPLQSFISFQMRLEVIKKLLVRDQKMAMEDMTQLQDICRKQITDMRAFVRSMRTSADGATPATNLRQIAEDFQKTSGINLVWNLSDTLSGLEPEISHEILQIIREALHNAQKHSKASKVTLLSEKIDGNLQLTVHDDGSGFPFAGTYSLDELELMRMGPESIKRRIRTLNGELVVESTPGRGSVLRIRVPL